MLEMKALRYIIAILIFLFSFIRCSWYTLHRCAFNRPLLLFRLNRNVRYSCIG